MALKTWVEPLIDKRNIIEFAMNPSSETYKLFKKEDVSSLHFFAWFSLCMNPSDWALDFIEENPNYINYNSICINTNPRVERMLKDKNNYICWETLIKNKSDFALRLMEENPSNVKWDKIVLEHPMTDEYENFVNRNQFRFSRK